MDYQREADAGSPAEQALRSIHFRLSVDSQTDQHDFVKWNLTNHGFFMVPSIYKCTNNLLIGMVASVD